MNVLLLEEMSGVVSSNIVGQRSNSILEIDQIEEQVGEGGVFWVAFESRGEEDEADGEEGGCANRERADVGADDDYENREELGQE